MVVVYMLFLIIAGLLGYFSMWAFEINTQAAHLAKYFWILTGGLAVIVAFLAIVSQGVWKLLKEMRQTEMIDNRFVIEKLFDANDIKKITSELADRIFKAYKKDKFKVLTLGMGGLYFANNLISKLKEDGMTNVELISAFTDRVGDEVTIEKPQESDIRGENILIVDDLVSTGVTMVKAIEMCKSLGAKTVRTCAMLDAFRKRRPSTASLRLDFPGLRSAEANRFFVGSGLDGGKKMSAEAGDKVRMLPYIGVLVAPQDDGS
jgi:hypoxanthine phosphoribosyltransferase